MKLAGNMSMGPSDIQDIHDPPGRV